ncbi:MAG TPA: flagellar biosynthetic protein FliO [Acidobacteriaceae bacterium]|jgi:flagellar biogenesis protein FliO
MATAAQWTVTRGQDGWAGVWMRWMRGLVKTRMGGEAPLRVEGRISLGGKKSLVLVDCRGRQVLLAVSGDAVTPVMELTAPRRTRKAKP